MLVFVLLLRDETSFVDEFEFALLDATLVVWLVGWLVILEQVSVKAFECHFRFVVVVASRLKLQTKVNNVVDIHCDRQHTEK